MSLFEHVVIPANADCIAPDGSEIRLLAQTVTGSSCHARLLAGRTAVAVCHRTVDELWFCLRGAGEIWRKAGDREEVASLREGISVSLPRGTSFQWRNVGPNPLDILIATIPPWPGPDEAYEVLGKWVAGERIAATKPA